MSYGVDNFAFRVCVLAGLIITGLGLCGEFDGLLTFESGDDSIFAMWSFACFLAFALFFIGWVRSKSRYDKPHVVKSMVLEGGIGKKILYYAQLPVDPAYAKKIYATFLGITAIWLVVSKTVGIVMTILRENFGGNLYFEFAIPILIGILICLWALSGIIKCFKNLLGWIGDEWRMLCIERQYKKEVLEFVAETGGLSNLKDDLEKLTFAETKMPLLNKQLAEKRKAYEGLMVRTQSQWGMIISTRDQLSYIVAGLSDSKPDKIVAEMKKRLIDIHNDLFQNDDKSRRASLHKGAEDFVVWKKKRII